MTHKGSRVVKPQTQSIFVILNLFLPLLYFSLNSIPEYLLRLENLEAIFSETMLMLVYNLLLLTQELQMFKVCKLVNVYLVKHVLLFA